MPRLLRSHGNFVGTRMRLADSTDPAVGIRTVALARHGASLDSENLPLL